MNNQTLRYKFDGGLEYLKFTVPVLCSLYFTENKLAKREVEWFALCLYSMSLGFDNVFSKGFKNIFEEHYYNEQQTKKQRDSLFCTVRRTLVKKGYITYSKDTGKVKVNPYWINVTKGINMNLSW